MFNILEAFLLHLMQGLTFEFADDLLCWASDAWFGGDLARCRANMVAWSYRTSDAAPYAAFLGTLIGYAASPLSIIVAAFMARPKSPGEAFGRAFSIELVEGAIAVVGQMITDQNMGVALWSLALSGVIAPIRGSVSAFTYAWETSGAFKFVVLLLAIGGVVTLLSAIGILPV